MRSHFVGAARARVSVSKALRWRERSIYRSIYTRNVNCALHRCSRSIYPNLRGVFRTRGQRVRKKKGKERKICDATQPSRIEKEKKARPTYVCVCVYACVYIYMYPGCKAAGWAQRHVPGSTTHWLQCNFQWTTATAARCITSDGEREKARRCDHYRKRVKHVE